mgnify:CR=1 FL=1
MFELTKEEYVFLRSQNASLETGRGKYSKFLPFAFTEQGVAMLASVLNSEKAIQINIQIMRVFVHLRQQIAFNDGIRQSLEVLEAKFDKQFDDVYEVINYLLKKDNQEVQQQSRKRIGFKSEQTGK